MRTKDAFVGNAADRRREEEEMFCVELSANDQFLLYV
jgi:hypothetical protein